VRSSRPTWTGSRTSSGDQVNPEVERLKAELAKSQAEAAEKGRANADLLTRSIEVQAKEFATDIIAGQCKAVPFERAAIVEAISLALRDDHDHPISGKPTARRDAIRAIYQSRTPHTLTREVGATDPKLAGRALASDPAADTTLSDDPEAAERARREREERRQRNYANAERHNPKPVAH
jgi:hypothetical protein